MTETIIGSAGPDEAACRPTPHRKNRDQPQPGRPMMQKRLGKAMSGPVAQRRKIRSGNPPKEEDLMAFIPDPAAG